MARITLFPTPGTTQSSSYGVKRPHGVSGEADIALFGFGLGYSLSCILALEKCTARNGEVTGTK